LELTKVDKDGNTPLHTACGRCGIELLRETKNRNNYFVCLDILLHYIDCDTLNLKANNTLTALHWACPLGNDVAVKKLLQHPDLHLNLCDACGYTPLFHSVYESDLLSKETNINGFASPPQAWNLTCLRLLLDHNECLIFGRTRDGNRLIDLARNRFHLICNVPVHKRNESLTNDFLKIIEEIEHYMVKARWKVFHFFQKKYFHRKSNVNRLYVFDYLIIFLCLHSI
jgi:hypothetical protein